MNDATSATYEANGKKTPDDTAVGRTGQPARKHLPGQVRRLLIGGEYALVNTPARWEVREEKGFYIPEMLSDKENPPDREIFNAASDHAVHLAKAQGLVADAMHLVRMMAEALGQVGDRRAEQTDAACRAIERPLSEAYNLIDRHDTRHINLFLAYFDLKLRAEDGESS